MKLFCMKEGGKYGVADGDDSGWYISGAGLSVFKENVRGENQGAVLCVYASAERPVFSLPVSVV